MITGNESNRVRGFRALALRAAPVLLSAFAAAPGAFGNAFVQMEFNVASTNRQRDAVFIELFDDRPLTRDNFLQYVNGGHYNSSLIHRLARPDGVPFVLQGGGFYPSFQSEDPPLNSSLNPAATVDLDNNPSTPLPTVPNEFGNQPPRSNVKGTLAMAKQPGNPDSATSQFFFNLNDNRGTPPNGLDYQNGGFTVFAQVVGDGMGLVDLYSTLPILNLNPDVNNDGVRDSNAPFANVPIYPEPGRPTFIPLVVKQARQINYYGSGPAVNIPNGELNAGGRDAFVDAGAVINGTDPLTIAAGRRLGVREGTALLQRSLVNRGTLAPGLQVGAVAVASYTQFATGTLEIQLAGTTIGTHYDQLNVTGSAFLSGSLDISLAGGYAPKHGDGFQLLTAAGGVVGNFIDVDLPMLTGGLVWSFGRTLTGLSLSVARADFNRDGVVDTADYILWRKNFNRTGTGLLADGNGDGKVDNADFQIWRSNLGGVAGTPPGSGAVAGAAVPEPGAAGLLVVAALLLSRRRRRG
jgi:cyclophilin family peptidyl-prolyl cis-trans isomerase